MHCRRFIGPADHPPRDARALRQRLRRRGAGGPAGRAGVRGASPRRRRRPARAPAAALPGEGAERDLPVHGRRAVAGGHVRPQAAARPRARPADQDEESSRRSSTTSATCSSRPWEFRQYGQSGIPVSDLFPHVAERVDDLAIVRSMVSNFSEHTGRQLLPAHRLGPPGAAQPGGLGRPTAWAASAATCPGSSSSTAA